MLKKICIYTFGMGWSKTRLGEQILFLFCRFFGIGRNPHMMECDGTGDVG